MDAAVAELQEVAGGRGDLLAEQAGLTLAFRDRDERDGLWPRRAPEAALLIAAGADLTQLTECAEERTDPLDEGRTERSPRASLLRGSRESPSDRSELFAERGVKPTTYPRHELHIVCDNYGTHKGSVALSDRE
jgi:hypothetical protein